MTIKTVVAAACLALVSSEAACSEMAVRDQVSLQKLSASASQIFRNRADASLVEAAGRGDLKGAQQAIANGADVNAKGDSGLSPLLFVLAHRNVEGFGFLLDHGADPNVVGCCDAGAHGDVHTVSVMGAAAGIDDPRFLELLVAHHGDPNLKINELDETPIFRALLGQNPHATVPLLLKAGANPNVQDKMSRVSVLATAVSSANFVDAAALLDAGADPTLKDRWGHSVIDDLMRNGNRGTLVFKSEQNRIAYRDFVGKLRAKNFLTADPPDFAPTAKN